MAVAQGFCPQPYDIDFTDSQMHLPCPESFLKYTLPNGLSVEVTDPPTEYRFNYEYTLGPSCAFDLTFRALHEPFDATDPVHNPLASAAADERLGDEWGNASSSVALVRASRNGSATATTRSHAAHISARSGVEAGAPLATPSSTDSIVRA